MPPATHTSPLARQDGLVLFGLLLALLVIFAPFFVTSSYILPDSELGTDFDREVWPLATLVRDSVRESGTLPLWRSYLLSGAPAVGHPVVPLFYPPHGLIVIMPLPLALNLDALLHLWWAGAGVYLSLRVLAGARRESALIGAVIFALAPKWIAHLSGGHWPMIAAVAWWPWAWLFFHRYWRTGRARWSILFGVALAAQALNDGRYLALTGLWLGVCTLGYLQRERVHWLGWLRRAVIGWGVALIVMAGLAAVQVWPFLELLPFTSRSSLSVDDAAFGSLPPALLLGVLLPPTLKFPEWFLFPGAVTLILALAGTGAPRTRRIRWWLLGLLVSVILVLGPATPVYRVLWTVVPGFSWLRVPARWWLFALFALAVLASEGFERWYAGAIPRQQVARGLSALGILYLAAAGITAAAPGMLPFSAFPHVITLPVVGALLLRSAPDGRTLSLVGLLLIVDLAWTGHTLIMPQTDSELLAADAATASYLQSAIREGERVFSPYDSLSQAALVAYGLEAADGYDPFALAAYRDIMGAASGCDYEGYAVSIPATLTSQDATDECPLEAFAPRLDLLRLLNVRYIHFAEPVSFPGGEQVYARGDHRVYDIGPGQGRAFGVARGEVVDAGACADRIAAIDPAEMALIEKPLPFDADGAPPEVVRVGDSHPNSALFITQGSGLLVRSETWAPGWTATINGAETDVLRVDCALQGVWLPPGEHSVRFEYRPQGYIVGRWISLGSAGMLALSGAFWAAQMRRYPRRSPHSAQADTDAI